MEWSDEFNSFNSWKGLLYAPHYENIAQWGSGKKKGMLLLPPIEASLDPIEQCQLACNHCNAGRYLGKDGRRMSDKHIFDLVAYLAVWGVKAICFGGGGEPSLHTALPKAITATKQHGLESSVATNGIIMTTELFEAYKLCRWIGVSVDAGTAKTYTIGRKGGYFGITIKNIARLAKIRKDVSFKFLIFDYNQHEIFEACKLAKELGVDSFHARPADMRHQGMSSPTAGGYYDIEKINKQLAQCMELEDDNFKVFTVTHKFEKDFTPKRNFSQCYASPICIQLSPDGNIYLCPDTRHIDFYKLGSHENVEDIGKVWGSKKHYDLVFKNGCANCDSRCTFGTYNKQCEKLFINGDDPFCRNFV